MGQMSGMRQVSGEGSIDQLLAQAMQALAIYQLPEMDPQQPPQQPQPPPPPPPSRRKRTVWQGVIEWNQKSGNPNDQNGIKVQREVPCQVSSALTTAGEPEVNAEKWPKKLQMQLIPKALMLQFGTTFLRQSSNAIFHLSKDVDSSEAVGSLKEIMQSGFVGYVHFPKQENLNHDLRVLILVPIDDLHTYVGFIPNDQTGYIAAIRNVITKKQQTVNQKQQLFGEQGGPSNQPLNPGMGDPSDSGSSKRCGRRFTWPRSRGGTSCGSNVPFVPGRSGPYSYAQIPGTMLRPVTERQQNLMNIVELRQSLLAAELKELQFKVAEERPQIDVPSNLQEMEVSLLQLQPHDGNQAPITIKQHLRELLQFSHQLLSSQPVFGQRSGVAEMGQEPGDGQPPPANPGGNILPDGVI